MEELFLLLCGQIADPAAILEESVNNNYITLTAGMMKKLFSLLCGQIADTAAILEESPKSQQITIVIGMIEQVVHPTLLQPFAACSSTQ